MNGKLDKFTAARIRRFNATGMAVQKALPLEGGRFASRTQMFVRTLVVRTNRMSSYEPREFVRTA